MLFVYYKIFFIFSYLEIRAIWKIFRACKYLQLCPAKYLPVAYDSAPNCQIPTWSSDISLKNALHGAESKAGSDELCHTILRYVKFKTIRTLPFLSVLLIDRYM